MAIVSMIVNVAGAGTVPLGGIMAVGSAAAWTLPASGEIKDGFVLCNGASFPTGSHPSFSGNRPNLTDDRFLNGSNATGGTGGQNSLSIDTQLGTINFNHRHRSTTPNHTHNFAHVHNWLYYSSAGDYYALTSENNATTSISSSNTQVIFGEYSPAGIDDTGEASWGRPGGSAYYYTTGVRSAPSGSGGTALTGSDGSATITTNAEGANWAVDTDGATSKSLSYNAAHSHALTSGGSPVSDVRPKYFSVVYVMRVV